MRKLNIISLALGAVLLALSFSPSAKADNWDKKTVVTFDQDVEIPGQVLPAGTYVFKLLHSNSNRFVVQIWCEGESQLLATLVTIGDSFPNQTGDPYFVLDTAGTDEGYPPAIVSWFFAGSDEGRDFIYSGGYSTSRILDEPTYQYQPQTQPQTQPPAQSQDQLDEPQE
jgi:hypothetical protein